MEKYVDIFSLMKSIFGLVLDKLNIEIPRRKILSNNEGSQV